MAKARRFRHDQLHAVAGICVVWEDGNRPKDAEEIRMIRKLKSGEYRLYSRKVDPKSGRRRNLGTFKTRGAAEKHERAVQFFKHG